MLPDGCAIVGLSNVQQIKDVEKAIDMTTAYFVQDLVSRFRTFAEQKATMGSEHGWAQNMGEGSLGGNSAGTDGLWNTDTHVCGPANLQGPSGS